VSLCKIPQQHFYVIKKIIAHHKIILIIIQKQKITIQNNKSIKSLKSPQIPVQTKEAKALPGYLEAKM
jgi:hypothetical protein